jgi:hypothetical protein
LPGTQDDDEIYGLSSNDFLTGTFSLGSSARGFWGPHGDRLAWLLTGTILLTVLLYLATSYGKSGTGRSSMPRDIEK